MVINLAFSKPNSISHYVSPSYARGREFHRLLLTVARPLVKGHGIQPVPWLEWMNGSRTTCRSFDRPDLLRGDASDMVALDEASYVDEDPVNAVIRPMLSDRRGDLVLSTTPRGHDWVYKLYERGQRKEFNTESWRFPTSMGPCFQSAEGKAELELMRSTLPRVIWESEYEALPTANIARVFPAMDLDPCVVPDSAPVVPMPGRKYSLGVDIGRVHDHGAMVIQDDQGLVVWAERIPLNVSYEIQAERAALLQRKWSTFTVLDASGGGMGGHASVQYGVNAVASVYRGKIPNLKELPWNAQSKETMVQGLSVDLEQHKVKIPCQFRELVQEMAAYEYNLRPGGRYRYSAPAGHRDDLVSALLMANLARRNNWLGTGTGKSLALAF